MTIRLLATLCRFALGATIFSAAALAQPTHQPPPEFLDWPEITEGEKQMRAPLVEKDSGAEVLVWRVHVLDEVLSRNTLQRVFYNYVRLKVFNEEGKEQTSTIDLRNDERSSIIDVAGRTLKPDGTILQLEKSAIHERDVVRVGGRKRKVTSFAMPGVEPGTILEYRWKEVLDGDRIQYVRLQFQREFPIQKVTYFVKPLSWENTSYQMRFQAFHCQPAFGKADRDGYTPVILENVPPFREEPYAPSEPNLRPWVLAYYQLENPKDPDRYWSDIGKKAYQELKNALRTNDELNAATATATGQAQSDQDKVLNLIRYIQNNLRNVNTDLSDSEREKFQEGLPKNRVRTSAEIFKSGMGMPDELNVVFAAMAAQAGLDARLAYAADWNDVVFNPKTMTNRYYLDNITMAVKFGDSWKMYDVSTKLLTPGMLPWRQEGVFALVSDAKTPVFVQTETTPAKSSVEAKKGSFSLSVNGELEGDAEETFTGHRAFDLRSELREESQERREEWLRNRVIEMFPDAEVTEIAVENCDDPTRPLRFRYHLLAPQYAQVAGRRIFFHILPFQRSRPSPFSASERRNPVQFPYAWTETDAVRIRPPAGFVLDNASAPGGIGFGAAGGYNLTVAVGDNGQVIANRELTFVGTYFDAKDYPVVKQVFSEIQKRNTHTLALIKQ